MAAELCLKDHPLVCSPELRAPIDARVIVNLWRRRSQAFGLDKRIIRFSGE
jgi:hypothetical protein